MLSLVLDLLSLIVQGSKVQELSRESAFSDVLSPSPSTQDLACHDINVAHHASDPGPRLRYARVMTTGPTRVAQTSTEVKKLYKKNGPVLPERQQRQLERAADLEKRALGIREREERSKANKKKRDEKERKEAALRKLNGVGMATQLIGYRHTQAQMKKGMEAFLGYRKKSEQDMKKRELEVARQLEAAVEAAAKEPWDDDADETFDTPQRSTKAAEQWIDEDLDDETLLEVHDQVTSDPVEEATEAMQPPQAASSAPIAQSPRMGQPSKEGMDFIRIHGPINKMTDSLLDKLPEPLIELLSQDCSVDPNTWNPSPSLLHKLNPPGLPPHRLRIKVGCVVTVLRDLNSSSQLSRSQHLQLLRIEPERLECLVLDGQLQRTKAFLTKVPFLAKHRNEKTCLFQRIQFPIQVSSDFVPPITSRKPSASGFKKPTLSDRTLNLSHSASKRSIPTPKATSQINKNPSFRLPGLPASRTNPAPVTRPTLPLSPSAADGWDDFLDTATQIARDLSEPSSPDKAPPKPITNSKAPVLSVTMVSNALPPLSTQDLDFSVEDLDDSPIISRPKFEGLCKQSKVSAAPHMNKPMHPGISPFPVSPVPATDQRGLKRKCIEASDKAARSAVSNIRGSTVPLKRDSDHNKRRMQTYPLEPKEACKAATTKVASNTGAKRSVSKPSTMPPFSEFGLSTQEATSFFDDDDDLGVGSPPIAV